MSLGWQSYSTTASPSWVCQDKRWSFGERQWSCICHKGCFDARKGIHSSGILNFEKANESIPLDEWNMKVPTTLKPWPRGKRFISINNFGFGGSNAHCVLERPPYSLAELPNEVKYAAPRLFVLSAQDAKLAVKLMNNLGVYMEQHPEVFQNRLVHDIAYTLCQRRSHLPWRIAPHGFRFQ